MECYRKSNNITKSCQKLLQSIDEEFHVPAFVADSIATGKINEIKTCFVGAIETKCENPALNDLAKHASNLVTDGLIVTVMNLEYEPGTSLNVDETNSYNDGMIKFYTNLKEYYQNKTVVNEDMLNEIDNRKRYIEKNKYRLQQ